MDIETPGQRFDRIELQLLMLRQTVAELEIKHYLTVIHWNVRALMDTVPVMERHERAVTCRRYADSRADYFIDQIRHSSEPNAEALRWLSDIQGFFREQEMSVLFSEFPN